MEISSRQRPKQIPRSIIKSRYIERGKPNKLRSCPNCTIDWKSSYKEETIKPAPVTEITLCPMFATKGLKLQLLRLA